MTDQSSGRIIKRARQMLATRDFATSTSPWAVGDVDRLPNDVTTQISRRIDRLEREVQRRKRVNRALLVGAALLATTGLYHPAVIAARPAAGKGTDSPSFHPTAAAEAELACKALRSIAQRINKGVGVTDRDYQIIIWSRRLALARLHTADDEASRCAVFEAHRARMQELVAGASAHYRERRISDLERMETEYFRLEAERWSAWVKAGLLPGSVRISN
jgi:hypothetical protein